MTLFSMHDLIQKYFLPLQSLSYSAMNAIYLLKMVATLSLKPSKLIYIGKALLIKMSANIDSN
jgi:hypothetical protein